MNTEKTKTILLTAGYVLFIALMYLAAQDWRATPDSMPLQNETPEKNLVPDDKETVPVSDNGTGGSGKETSGTSATSGNGNDAEAQLETAASNAPEEKQKVTGKVSDASSGDPAAEKSSRTEEVLPLSTADRELNPRSVIVPGARVAGSSVRSSGGSGKPGKPGKSGFYGVEVRERSVIFIIDVSGSMASGSPEGQPRIDVMKRELVKAFESMKKHSLGARCRVIAFSSDVTAYPKNGDMVKLSDTSAYTALIDSVKALSASGGTDMLSALTESDKYVKTDAPDAFYLLSDGEPASVAEVVDYVVKRRSSQGGKVRINTFSIGGASEVMRRIADESKGKYVECF